MHVEQLASLTLSVAAADVDVVVVAVGDGELLEVLAAVDGVDVAVDRAAVDDVTVVLADVELGVLAAERVTALLAAGVPATEDVVLGRLLLAVLTGKATAEDNGASCGTVTTTVAPAGAAVADTAALEADTGAVLDVEVAMVHPARPTPSNPVRTVRNTAFRRVRRAGRGDMPRSYTTRSCDPGKPDRRPARRAGRSAERPRRHKALESPGFQSRPPGSRTSSTTRCS